MSDFAEFAVHNWLLFAALFAILGMLAGGEVLRKMRGIQTLNAVEALRLINDQDAWIIDIRDSGDYKDGHIPQARHIPFATLKDRLDELGKATGKPIIVYCHWRLGDLAGRPSADQPQESLNFPRISPRHAQHRDLLRRLLSLLPAGAGAAGSQGRTLHRAGRQP